MCQHPPHELHESHDLKCHTLQGGKPKGCNLRMGFVLGTVIVFLLTLSGATCVWLLKGELGGNTKKLLLGFAAGVMMAAAVWSLLIPALELASSVGSMGFGGKASGSPCGGGVLAGIAFLLLLDDLIVHLHVDSSAPEGPKAHLKKATMMFLAGRYTTSLKGWRWVCSLPRQRQRGILWRLRRC